MNQLRQRPTARLRVATVAILWSLLPAACGEPETVTIATVGNYHPFGFVDADGEIDGLERELGDELCRRLGIECEWIVNDWVDMIPDLRAEQFDVILSGMSITEEREALIDFTDAYYPPTPSVYVALAGAGDEAADGRIGVTANTIYSDYFTEMGRSFTPFDGSIDLVDTLFSNQVDAILVDHGYGVEKLAEHPGRLQIVGPSVVLDQGLGIGVRTGSDLRDRFNDALSAMKSDGTLNALIVKWVGPEASTFD